MLDTILEVKNVSKIFSKPTKQTRTTNIGWLAMLNILFSNNHKRTTDKSFKALDDITFSIKKGESIGIIGLNGAGKSTLVQIIAGTLQPSTGNIRTYVKVAALLELGTGFNPDFTGKENVIINANILGLKESDIRAKLPSIKKFANIGEFFDLPVKTYSSGMIMRLAFAVITQVNPKVLILDESLAVGDTMFVQKCYRFLKEFRKSNTLLLISHDVSSIKSLCQKCIWLHNGKVRKEGTAKRVTEQFTEFIASTQEKDEKSKDKNIDKLDETDLNEFGSEISTIYEYSITESETGEKVKNFKGFENVLIKFSAKCSQNIEKPIAGFYIRNRIGQEIFGENTWSKTKYTNFQIEKNKEFSVVFSFTMPRLPNGDYTISLAIADGDNLNHKIIHWIHDALLVTSVADNPFGLIGIPMSRIEFNLNSLD
jgi:lipopolysaccharide transport system ATP-binding protein